MKTFKSVVFASIVFDVYLQINNVIKETQYPIFREVQTCIIENIICLNNDKKYNY